MTDKQTRTWENGNMRFSLQEVREGNWILSARRIEDDARVWKQVNLSSGDASNEDLETIFLHQLADCLPDRFQRRCQACDQVLEADHTNATFQFDNALWIDFQGGYGMFVESYDMGGPAKVVICHDCAHDLCDKIPWIGKLIDPHNSHAHRTRWIESHPDHWGWDYPANEEGS